MTPNYWSQACAQLSDADPVMATLIAKFPDSILTKRGDAFTSLARAIVGQQISVKAAEAVWGRFLTTVNATDCPNPSTVAKTSDDDLRAAGLSMRKVGYVKALAQFVEAGHLRPQELDKLNDAEIVKELTALPGIGPWTAEMFLMFHLQRPNVWPVDDLGLTNALNKFYPTKKERKKADYRTMGEQFQPYRTVATWFLWRAIDPVPVEY